MGFFDRLLGRRAASGPAASGTASATAAKPLSLQLLFAEPPDLDQEALTTELRSFDPSMAHARCELDPSAAAQGTPLGLIGWGPHQLRLVGFDVPMPAGPLEACIQGAHYGQELKQRARAHKAHLLLFHAGGDVQPMEQYVALAAVAGVLAAHGALVVLNEAARTSLPAAPLGRDAADDAESALERLRTLPLPVLYMGFIKLEVQGRPGVWMRTHGGDVLGLPELAFHAEGHHQGGATLEQFDTILSYLQRSGAQIAPGHTMEVAPGEILRFRAADPREDFLDSPGPLLVVERT